MTISFTLKAFLSGKQHPFLNTFIFKDSNDELSQHFRHMLRDTIKKTEEGMFFDGSDNQIKELIGTGNVSIHSMLDRPLYVFPPQFTDIKIVLLNFNENSDELTTYCTVDLVEDNKQIMSFLSTNFSMENVSIFIDRYKKRDCGREKFLKNYCNTPTYDDQILTVILHLMENPLNGMKSCGYKERLGEKKYREK